MKVKGLIISITAGTALIVGTAYGIGMGMKKKAQPVEVVSVPSVNEASMGGMGGKMTPNAVLVIKDGHTKLINVKKQDSMTKLLDMIPDLVDRFTQPNMEEDVTKDEAVDMAFPEEE